MKTRLDVDNVVLGVKFQIEIPYFWAVHKLQYLTDFEVFIFIIISSGHHVCISIGFLTKDFSLQLLDKPNEFADITTFT
jgi:hypothetical protein